jgi:hypothetical protein
VDLNRSHHQLVQDVHCYYKKGLVNLTLRADLEPVVELWDARRKSGLFEKAFDVELGLKWASPAQSAAGLKLVGRRRAG